MNELTAALKEELNVDTAFTLPIFGGIDIPESIAVSWGIMAFLVIVSILLTRNLKVNHISKRQAILETAVVTMDNFFKDLLGEAGKQYVPYLITVALYIACSNLIGIIGLKPPTKDLNVTAALAMSGALELLREEAAHEGRQPFFDGRVIVHAGEGFPCGAVDLARRIAEAQHVVQEKVVQLVGADQIFGLLADLAVLGGQQLGRDWRVEYVAQYIGQLALHAVSLIGDEIAHERLGDRAVDAVHAHVVAVVGRPAERKL